MGHLTRQAAVALQLTEEHDATLFSMSLGLPVVLRLGLRGEYCPSHERRFFEPREWESYLKERIVLLARELNASVFVFDGVAPYLGIGRARAEMPDVRFVWLRRGMWRQGTGRMLQRSSYFDLIIEPGDLAGDADRGPTTGMSDAVRVNPISLLESADMLPRQEARDELGLPHDKLVALLTLGTGRHGEFAGPGGAAAAELLEHPDLHLAVTKWATANKDVPMPDGVTELRGVFPLVRYLNAFDLAVSSAGYNAVHEMVPAGIPTLFVANTATRTDDQVARAMRLAEKGLALANRDDDLEGVAHATRMLLDASLREHLAEAASSTRDTITGAADTAELITSDSHYNQPERETIQVMIGLQRDGRFRQIVKLLLGERGTAFVKRLLGRPVPKPTNVRSTRLLITSSVTVEDLRRDRPVEHILPDTSPEYQAARRLMIRRYYTVI